MTTNHHTPIATGAAANAATIEEPLAELDSAITDTNAKAPDEFTGSNTDKTNNNVSASAHGFAPKGSGSADDYLDGTGNYSVPDGTGSTNGHVVYDEETALTQRGNLKFQGTGVEVTDDVNGTLVTISAGGDVAGDTHAADAKSTPVDADEMPLVDSAASNALKKLSWSNLKATLKTYFDTLYMALTGNQNVDGVKTFTSFPITPSSAPTSDYQIANKKYVDDNGGEDNPDVVPQAEAEAGTATTERIWTAQRVKQAIDALVSSGWEVIEEVTLTSDGTFDLTSISGTYEALELVTLLRSDNAATSDLVEMTVNGSSTGYDYILNLLYHNSAHDSYESNNAAYAKAAYIPADTSPASLFSTTRMFFRNYAGSQLKNCQISGYTQKKQDTGKLYAISGGFTWRTTDAITQITLAPESGTNFKAGSSVLLLGLKSGSTGGSEKKRTLSVLVNDSTALASGDGKAYFPRIPSWMNGWEIIDVAANVVAGTGLVTLMIHNLTQAADILTTALTIDANEKDSKDAATPAVIDSGEKIVSTGDRLRVDVDGQGTGTTWCEVQVTLQEA